jgi:hypothetical protein
MEPLCNACRFVKRYCTSNRDRVFGIYAHKEFQFDLPGKDLYVFYRCLIKNEDVSDPFHCEYRETGIDPTTHDSI